MLLNNRYQLLQTLASGGFGQTYLAEDTHLPSHRKCVVKQLIFASNDPVITRLIQERFKKEAALLEKLGESTDQSPKLYAYFSQADQLYLIQEWIQGYTIAQALRTQGRFAPAAVKDFLINILPELDHVHA